MQSGSYATLLIAYSLNLTPTGNSCALTTARLTRAHRSRLSMPRASARGSGTFSIPATRIAGGLDLIITGSNHARLLDSEGGVGSAMMRGIFLPNSYVG